MSAYPESDSEGANPSVLSAERPAAETTSAERPAVETTSAERPAVETTSAERPAVETTSAERPAVETTSAERPAAKTTSAERPAAETTSAERPAVETTSAERPAVETTSAERPAVETTSAERPAAKTTSAERPAAETTSAERPAVETTSAERPAAETTSAERPAVETTSAERPAVETTSAEPPAAETTSAERPAAETTSAERPAAETTSAERPAAKTTSAERPAVETTSAEPPAAETTSAEPPAAKTALAPPQQSRLQMLSWNIDSGEGHQLDYAALDKKLELMEKHSGTLPDVILLQEPLAKTIDTKVDHFKSGPPRFVPEDDKETKQAIFYASLKYQRTSFDHKGRMGEAAYANEWDSMTCVEVFAHNGSEKKTAVISYRPSLKVDMEKYLPVFFRTINSISSDRMDAYICISTKSPIEEGMYKNYNISLIFDAHGNNGRPYVFYYGAINNEVQKKAFGICLRKNEGKIDYKQCGDDLEEFYTAYGNPFDFLFVHGDDFVPKDLLVQVPLLGAFQRKFNGFVRGKMVGTSMFYDTSFTKPQSLDEEMDAILAALPNLGCARLHDNKVLFLFVFSSFESTNASDAQGDQDSLTDLFEQVTAKRKNLMKKFTNGICICVHLRHRIQESYFRTNLPDFTLLAPGNPLSVPVHERSDFFYVLYSMSTEKIIPLVDESPVTPSNTQEMHRQVTVTIKIKRTTTVLRMLSCSASYLTGDLDKRIIVDEKNANVILAHGFPPQDLEGQLQRLRYRTYKLSKAKSSGNDFKAAIPCEVAIFYDNFKYEGEEVPHKNPSNSAYKGTDIDCWNDRVLIVKLTPRDEKSRPFILISYHGPQRSLKNERIEQLAECFFTQIQILQGRDVAEKQSLKGMDVFIGGDFNCTLSADLCGGFTLLEMSGVRSHGKSKVGSPIDYILYKSVQSNIIPEEAVRGEPPKNTGSYRDASHLPLTATFTR